MILDRVSQRGAVKILTWEADPGALRIKGL